MGLGFEKFDQITKHLDCKRFPTIGNVLPTFNLVDDAADFWCETLAELFQLARIARIGTGTERGDGEEIFFYSSAFYGSALDRVSGGQMHGIKCYLPDASLDWAEC